jgi:inhibitor of KinA
MTGVDAAWRIDAVGDGALLVGFGDSVDPATSERVHAFVQHLLEAPLAGVRDVVPAFTTVTLHYRPEQVEGSGGFPFDRLRAQVLQRLALEIDAHDVVPRVFEVPVWYGGEAGPDLEDVARQCGLSEADVVRRHGASPHRVYMLGFAPGFPFIGGLDPALAMPRRTTPRTHVPAGTVAIARDQTCIYPLETPGGWNLIGRTPLRLFDPAAAVPCLMGPGDAIRFVPIDEAAYRAMLAGRAGEAA